MNGLWLASYVLMWVLIVFLGLVNVGILRELGRLGRLSSVGAGDSEMHVPALHEDGPDIGSEMLSFDVESVNGRGAVAFKSEHRAVTGSLVTFISPMCRGCHDIAVCLDEVTQAHGLRSIVVMRSEKQTCEAFLRMFPLESAVVLDSDNSMTMAFQVHRAPMGLLYAPQGTLMRKGVINSEGSLRALLGEAAGSAKERAGVFPPLDASDILALSSVND